MKKFLHGILSHKSLYKLPIDYFLIYSLFLLIIYIRMDSTSKPVVEITADAVGIFYQRPSTALLPILIVNKNQPCADMVGEVLFNIHVTICDTLDGVFAPMMRSDYTLQVGSCQCEPLDSAETSEVSHDSSWHTLPMGTTSLIRVSPLERSVNTGRFMRVKISVQSFAHGFVGEFISEPRVIMSRAGNSNAILKVLLDRPASMARTIGQRYTGALNCPTTTPRTLPGLAKALHAAATRASVRKPSKRGRKSSQGTTDDADEMMQWDDDSSDGCAVKTLNASPVPPVLRGTLKTRLAGRKRSAAEAASVYEEPRLTSDRLGVLQTAVLISAPGAEPPTCSTAISTQAAAVEAVTGDSDNTAALYVSSHGLLPIHDFDDEVAAGSLPTSPVYMSSVASAVRSVPPPMNMLLRSLSENLELMCSSYSFTHSGSAVVSFSPPLAPSAPARISSSHACDSNALDCSITEARLSWLASGDPKYVLQV